MRPKTIEEWRKLPVTPFNNVKEGKPRTYVKTTGYKFDAGDTVNGSYSHSFKHKVSFHLYEERHDGDTPLPSLEKEVVLPDGTTVSIPEIQFGLQPNVSRYRESNLPKIGRDLDEIASQGEQITIGGRYQPKGRFPFFRLEYLKVGDLELKF